jgi:hypothetical protein
MIYDERSAVDANWRTLIIEGQPVRCKKTEFSAKSNTENVLRSGSDSVEAYTIGTNEVEDSTWEFDYMGGVAFMRIFGVTDQNPTLTSFAGREFEAVERVSDPRPLGTAGGHTNIAKGCRVIGIKWGFEQGPAAATFSVTVKIRKVEVFRGAAGGGATLGLS